MRALAFLLCLLAVPVSAQAKDAAGSKDSPLVGRYQGSQISFYATRDFDDAWLLQAPLNVTAISAGAKSAHGGEEWLKVQGRSTDIRYDGPVGRSSLEIIGNLQSGLTAKGFTTLFDCADTACFTGATNDSYLLGWYLDDAQQNGRYAAHARYTLASLDRPEGKVYVALLVGEATSGPTVFLRIVELKPMDAGKVVFIDADAMQKSLAASGRVALYGIYFDTDRDTLKPDFETDAGSDRPPAENQSRTEADRRWPHRQPGRVRLQCRSFPATRGRGGRRAGGDVRDRQRSADAVRRGHGGAGSAKRDRGRARKEQTCRACRKVTGRYGRSLASVRGSTQSSRVE